MKRPQINEKWRNPEAVKRAQAELGETMELLNRLGDKNPLALFLGSARTPQNDPVYQHAYETAKELGRKGMAVISGGGTGIMEAASKGAKDSGAPSIALTSSLLSAEQVPEDLHDHRKALAMFFTRRFGLLTAADVSLIYPGGYGTINEMSEILMLLQNRIVDMVQIYLVQTRKNLLQTIRSQGLTKTAKDITKNPIELLWLLAPEGEWEGFRSFAKRHMLRPGYISPGDEKMGEIVNIEQLSGTDLAQIIAKKTQIDTMLATRS